MITSIEYYYVLSSFEYSLDCLRTFPGMFGDISRNVKWHSPEWLVTFPRIFYKIPWNIWRHSPDCFTTLPGMFGDIPWNITIPHSSRSPHSFHILVFLVLYIAQLLLYWFFWWVQIIYEQVMNNSVINNSIEIYQFVFHWQNIDLCYIKSSIKIWQLTIFLAKNWYMSNKKFFSVLNYLKLFKAVHKKNSRTHSPQQNKKAVLSTAAYFKVSTPVRSHRQ